MLYFHHASSLEHDPSVLEGGYQPPALARCVLATIEALAGVGTAESIAPDPFVTSRVAAHVGHFWTL